MILLYMLFALTVSTVLTALISERVPQSQSREKEVFIGFFAALMVLAWAADKWLFPTLAAGQRTSWPSILVLILFGGVFAASTILSVKTSAPPRKAVVNHSGRLDTEAMVFDVVLWFALLTIGIVALRSILL